MGVVARQSFQSSVFTYSGIVLGIILNAYIWPLCFSVPEVGTLRVLTEVSTLLSSFVHLAMPATISRFFPYFKNEEKKHHGLLYLVTSVTAISFVIFSGLFLAFKGLLISMYAAKSPLFANYIIYLLPLTFFTSFTILYETYAASNLRIGFPKFLREFVFRLLLIIFSLLALYNIFSFNDFLIAQIATLAAVLFGILFYIKKSGFWLFTRKITFTQPWLAREIVKFNAFVVFGGIGGILVTKIDILMIGLIPNGDYHNGIYTTAVLFSSIIEIPGRSIGQASLPILADHIQTDNRREIRKIYETASIIQLTIAVFLFNLIWSNIDNIFDIMPNGEIYRHGKTAFLFLALSQVFNMATSLNGAILGISKYYRFATYSIFFLAVATVLFNLWLIPRYGLNGAAIGAALTLFLYQALIWLFVKIKMKLDPFTSNTLKPLVLGIAAFAVNHIIPDMGHPFIDGSIRSLVNIVIFLAGIKFLRVSPYFDDILAKALKVLKLRKP